MALTPEQIKELKEQLKQQVKTLPDEQKAAALKQIESMSPAALESMLKQQQSQTSQPVFRMIVSGEIPSVKISESQHAIAVLSVRAVSEGHTIIIPKKEIASDKELPSQVNRFAETVSKNLLENLGAKSIRKDIQTIFGEKTISLIPIYDKPLDLNSKATEKTPEELEEVKKKIEIIKISKTPKKIKLPKKPRKRKKIIRLKRRIP